MDRFQVALALAFQSTIQGGLKVGQVSLGRFAVIKLGSRAGCGQAWGRIGVGLGLV